MAVVQSDGSLVALGPQSSWVVPPSRRFEMLDYSGRNQTYAELYRRQPNLRLVVRFLGRNVAQLTLAAYQRVSSTERLTLEPSDPANLAVLKPNPYTTKHRLIRAIVEDRAIYDDAFLLKARNPATGAPGLVRIPPQLVQPIGSGWLYPDGWRVTFGGNFVEYPPEDVVHFHGFNPEDQRVGSSPIEALRRILAEDDSAGKWREEFWQGSARISGWISRSSDAARWSEQARDRAREGWANAYRGGGGKAGETPILEDGMEFHESGFSARDSEYLSARKLTREECAAAYFIPPAFVGILENANFSNMEEQHISLYVDTLGPMLDEISSDFDLQLLPDITADQTVYYAFDLEEKLKGDFSKEATALQSAVGAPWMTRNEARARKHLPPVPDGDKLVTPLNVITGGLASPNDTAPPPSGQASRVDVRRKSAASAARLELWKRELRKYDEPHRRLLEDFFQRQSSTVIAGLGAGKSLEEAFDNDRWDRELGDDLVGLAFDVNADLGGIVAEHFGADYDATLAAGWLDANGRAAAANINRQTKAALASAIAGVKSGRKASTDDLIDDPDEDPLELDDAPDLNAGGPPSSADLARDVFALAVAARAVQLATSRSTGVGNFSLHDGAKQAGARSKVWSVTSSNSRHAELDGETVPIGDDFSIGGPWPGSASLGVDETAGCTCLLDFSTEGA